MTRLPIDRVAAEIRLRAQVVVNEGGCWEWQGNRLRGYGRVSLNNQLWFTHRIAAHVWLGLDLANPDECACHRCDNPPCINPDHLFVGTRADNTADCVAKGRFVYRSPIRPSKYPQFRTCDVCGEVYEPKFKQRSKSRVCSAECIGKLRSINATGRGHKLTADDVRVIRAGLESGKARVELAAEFAVSRRVIGLIDRRELWGHVA